MVPQLGATIPVGPQGTLLPENRPLRAQHEAGASPEGLARAHPAESLPWALLAERALDAGEDLNAYAFARTGYHRGLDALRRAGWRGAGLVPWSHEPNRGFLRALRALGVAAAQLGEADEQERIGTFLRECDPTLAGD